MANPKIVIVDYGVGNLFSLRRAFSFLKTEAIISEDKDDLTAADALVLPGVGSFEAGIRGLAVRGLAQAIKDAARNNKPILGICLGAQLLLSEGYEFGRRSGLGVIPGKVIRLPIADHNVKIPQIGWNAVYAADTPWKNSILESCRHPFNAYFVHSYIFVPQDKEDIFALTNYGGYEFCSIVKKGAIYGCQFHPEKSGEEGLKIIGNFIKTI